MGESILIVPREAIGFDLPQRGFLACETSTATDLLVPRRFVDRNIAEKDSSLKQIIPYVVLRDGHLIFRYWRTKRAGESRLHHLHSIGVGGHINERDLNLFSQSEEEILIEAAMRELQEEVNVRSNLDIGFCGILNDDETEVGSVHLGMVFACSLDSSQVEIRETGALARGEWLGVGSLNDGVEYESWSQILIDDWLLPEGGA